MTYARHAFRAFRAGVSAARAVWADYRAFSVEYEGARRSMASLQHWGSPPTRPDDTGFSDGLL